jgi:NTE family protein
MKRFCSIITCLCLTLTGTAQMRVVQEPVQADGAEEHSNVVSSPLMDRIAVISGGGAYGAWGAGLSERLYNIRLNNRNQSGNNPSGCRNCGDYQMVIGTSTGSLMAPLVLVNRYADLRDGYTKVTQDDIFNVNPFKENGELRSFLFLTWRFIFYNSLGESEPLRDLVKKFYTKPIHDEIVRSGKEFIVTVANMADGQAYYMSSAKYAYDESAEKFGGSKKIKSSWNSMVNWTWASANEPVFMSIFKTPQFDKESLQVKVDEQGKKIKREDVWQDGGVMQAVSLIEGLARAIDKKIYNIDVIVHGTLKSPESSYQGKGSFNGLKRTIEILTQSVKRQNVEMGLLKQQTLANGISSSSINSATSDTDFTITIYYMTEAVRNMQPNANELVFDGDTMNKLYETGLRAKPDSLTFVVPIKGVKEIIEKSLRLK